MAPDELGRYRLLEMLAYISSEIHKAFHPLFHSTGAPVDRKKATDAITDKLAYVATVAKGTYLFGADATAADCYLLVMLLWAAKQGITISAPLKTLSDHMKSRRTVQAALNHESLA